MSTELFASEKNLICNFSDLNFETASATSWLHWTSQTGARITMIMVMIACSRHIVFAIMENCYWDGYIHIWWRRQYKNDVNYHKNYQWRSTNYHRNYHLPITNYHRNFSAHIAFAIMENIRNNFADFYPTFLLHIFPVFHYPFYRWAIKKDALIINRVVFFTGLP